jgi:Mrp family chromosome partitioning ATPase
MEVESKKKTLVINMFGAPGVGKSTTAAMLFAMLKDAGVDCEMSSEFAKDLVWECRYETFKDELYIFAKQYHKLFRLEGKVDAVVTDHPLLLTAFYAKGDPDLVRLCESRFASCDNFNVLIARAKPYNPNGRNQTLEESDEIGKGVEEMLKAGKIPYYTVPGDGDAARKIMGLLKGRLAMPREKNPDFD